MPVPLFDSVLAGPIAVVGLLAVVLVAHEIGHYAIAGLAGVPASDRRIVFTAFPPHVALPYDGEWVSPFDRKRFATAYGRYDPERRYAPAFTAGGFFGQIALVILAVAVDVGTGVSVGTAIVLTSLWFTVGYLGYDLAVTAWQRSAHGDTSHLWRLGPRYAVATHVAFVGSHGALLLVLT